MQAFDKLEKGDKVDIDYTESVAISMLPKGTKPSESEASATAHGAKEEGAGKQVTVSAEVLQVDAARWCS